MNSAHVKYIAVLILLICAAFAHAEDSYSVEKRLDIIKSYASFELAKETSVVLVIGNNDSGKDYLMRTFKKGTDDPFRIVYYTNDDSNIFVRDNNTLYYNCPGFDSKTNSNDAIILTMHCIHGVLNYAHEIKLLFVIEKVEEIERLTEFVVSFMKNFNKFKDGIALIQTIPGRESNYSVVNSIVNELNAVKKRVQRKKQKKFIDILLQKPNDEYNKIGFFHIIGENELYTYDEKTDKPKMVREIDAIRTIVNSNLKFVRKDEINFEFSRSFAELKVNANDLISALQNQIESSFDIANRCNIIKSYYESEKTSEFSVWTTGTHIYKFDSTAKWPIAKQISYKINTLHIYDWSKLMDLHNSAELLDFLQMFSNNHNGLRSSHIVAKLETCLSDFHHISCTADKLIVKGFVLFISTIIKDAECWSTAKTIDIYAFDTVFVDADLSEKAKTAKITIFSPTQKILASETSGVFVDFLGACNFTVNEQYNEKKYIDDNENDYDKYVESRAMVTCRNSDKLKSESATKIDELRRKLGKAAAKITKHIKSFSNKAERQIDITSFPSPLKWQYANQLYKVNALGIKTSTNALIEFSEDADLLDFLEVFNEKKDGLTSSKLANDLENELKPFNNLLFNISCSTDKLVVKGFIVFISDVIKDAKCWTTVSVIDIYAVDKVFVDVDIDNAKKAAQLTIISPLWEIIPSAGNTPRRILLTGANGKDYESAAEGGIDISSPNGEAGKDGRSGGTGSNVGAIGSSFINDRFLEIDVGGGNGGAGQDGGKGLQGAQGSSPDMGKRCGTVTKGNHCERNKCYPSVVRTCMGNANAAKSGNGGDGGCAGVGGDAGQFAVIGLKYAPEFRVRQKSGEYGVAGNGGSGGSATYNKKCTEMTYSTKRERKSKIKCDNVGTILGGNKGENGGYCPIIKSPSIYFNPSSSIIAYKEFLNKKEIRNDFFVDLIENDDVNELYTDTINFIEDFKSLEDQHSILRTQDQFYILLYESLRNRIEKYRDSVESDAEGKYCMDLLHADVNHKIDELERITSHGTDYDPSEYLEPVTAYMENWKEQKRIANAIEILDNYKSEIQERIQQAHENIEKVFAYYNEMNLDATKQIVQKLLHESFDKQNQSPIKIEENKRSVESLMEWRTTTDVVKTISPVFRFLSNIASIISSIAVGTPAVKSTNLANQYQSVEIPIGPIRKLIHKVSSDLKYKSRGWLQHISFFELIVKQCGFEDDKGFSKILSDFKSKLQNDIKNETITSFDVEVEGSIFQQGLEKVFKLILGGPTNAFAYLWLNRASTATKSYEFGINPHRFYLADEKTMNELTNQINAAQNQISTWKMYEQQISNDLILLVQSISSSFEGTIKDFDGKSHVQLDTSKWHIQTTLSKIAKNFEVLTQHSHFKVDLKSFFDNVHDALLKIIDVYDYIESCKDNQKLAEIIVGVASGPAAISNSEIRKAMLSLQITFYTNLINDYFNAAERAVKQSKFPFASHYLGEFTLTPSSHESALDRIAKYKETLENKLKNKLEDELNTKREYRDIEIKRENINFYTWNLKDEHEILRLINGEAIQLTSYISNGFKESAVKFKLISVLFTCDDKNVENQLNSASKNMTMIGDNFYRCNNRIYSVPMDHEVKLNTIFTKHEPVPANRFHKYIYENDHYYLSPFSKWIIQLDQPIQLVNPATKINNLKVMLTGFGEYLINLSDKICNNHELTKYYGTNLDAEN